MSTISMEEFVDRLVKFSDRKARMDYLRDHRRDLSVEVVAALKKRVDQWVRVDARRASQIADLAQQTARLIPDARAQALGLRAQAQARHALGSFEKAWTLYEQARRLYDRQGQVLEAAKVQRSQVDVLMYMGRYPEALETAQQARAVFVQHREPLLVAQLDTNVGNVYHRWDQHNKALELYDRARTAFAGAGDRAALALVDFNRANALVHLNQMDQALPLYAQTHDLFQACQMPLAATQVLYNMAYAHFLRSDYQEALRLLAQARARHAELGDQKHLALSDLDSAEIHLQLNMFQEALDLAGRAYQQFKKLRMNYELAKALLFKAIATFHRQDFLSAECDLRAAKKIFLKEENAIGAALADVYLSDLYVKTGNPGRAVPTCRAALPVFRKHKLWLRVNYTRLLLARALLGTGRRAAARALCRSLRTSLRHHRTAWLAYQYHHLQGTLSELDGRPASAYRSYDRAIGEIEAMRRAIPADEFRTHFIKDKLAVYEDMVMLCLRSGRPARRAEAFAYIERCKSRTLLDGLVDPIQARRPFPDSDDAALRRRWEQLCAELNRYYSQLNQAQSGGDQRALAAVCAIEREIDRREKALGQMWRQWQVRAARSGARPNPRPFTLTEAQAGLSADEVLLEYYFAGDRLKIFAVSREDCHVASPAVSKEQLKILLRNLRFQIEKFTYDKDYVHAHGDHLCRSADVYLRQLYAALIQPVQAQIEKKKLIVVPFDLLHYVPFHALEWDGHYLIDQHELSYAPSARVWHWCRTRRPAPSGRPLVLGVPDARVPHISEEIRALAHLFPEARLFEGAAATRAALLTHAAQASIVHLAAHSVFRYDNPMFSALRLADAWLSFSDIYQLELNADLVMLSGCNTGLNRVLAGDELLGLARGFLWAGAASLIVSLWAISDRATAEFMETFYRHLQAGAAKRTALREAQLAMKARYRHPYFWAPFVLIGRE